MKNKLMIFAAIVSGLIITQAVMSAYEVSRRDLKLASQQLLEKFSASAPAASDSNVILLENDGDDDGTGATVSTFLAQPDFSRNVSIKSSGTTADIAAGAIVVTGTDQHGSTISETFPVTVNTALNGIGTKAFKTVTSVTFPAEDSPYGAKWSIGYRDVLGLHRCMDDTGQHFHSTFGGTKEGTEATLTVDATTISNNTIDLNSALDGSNDVEAFFMQNYRCSP